MDEEVQKLELGILAALSILLVLAFSLAAMGSLQNVLIELLLIVLISVELVSLSIQVRESDET